MFQRYLYKNLAGVQLVEEVGAEQGGKMLSCRGKKSAAGGKNSINQPGWINQPHH